MNEEVMVTLSYEKYQELLKIKNADRENELNILKKIVGTVIKEARRLESRGHIPFPKDYMYAFREAAKKVDYKFIEMEGDLIFEKL